MAPRTEALRDPAPGRPSDHAGPHQDPGEAEEAKDFERAVRNVTGRVGEADDMEVDRD